MQFRWEDNWKKKNLGRPQVSLCGFTTDIYKKNPEGTSSCTTKTFLIFIQSLSNWPSFEWQQWWKITCVSKIVKGFHMQLILSLETHYLSGQRLQPHVQQQKILFSSHVCCHNCICIRQRTDELLFCFKWIDALCLTVVFGTNGSSTCNKIHNFRYINNI